MLYSVYLVHLKYTGNNNWMIKSTNGNTEGAILMGSNSCRFEQFTELEIELIGLVDCTEGEG